MGSTSPDSEIMDLTLQAVPDSHLQPTASTGRNSRKLNAEAHLRRPTAAGKPWYRTEAQWAAYSNRRKTILSHVGRIYETAEGERTTMPCEQCAELGDDDCMVYTKAARQKYHFSNAHSAKCARCRYNHGHCSFEVLSFMDFLDDTELSSLRTRQRKSTILDGQRKEDLLVACEVHRTNLTYCPITRLIA